jgi:hypothetical protein
MGGIGITTIGGMGIGIGIGRFGGMRGVISGNA